MCGFVAVVTERGRKVPGVVVAQMTNMLAHRGPDGFGYAQIDPETACCETWTTDFPMTRDFSGIVFWHRRLSILDLSPAAHQPFVSDDGSLVLAYKGEIYNFVELRKELEQFGTHFRSQSDTEVLLYCYRRWGVEALRKFNGMWAFVLWDARTRTLVASRDRLGVKPLYYAFVNGAWLFASEIKALLTYPGVWQGFAEQDCLNFLVRGFVHDAGLTLFRNIHAVPPGHYMQLSERGLSSHQYWFVSTDPGRQWSEHEAVAEFRQLLTSAVVLRTRSDVPIGTMLSGGLDSAAITGLLHRHQHMRDSVGTVGADGLRSFHQTFSACWPLWDSNEEKEIDLLSSKWGLLSHKAYPTGHTLCDILPHVVLALDEPFESPIALVQYLLMQEAHKHGVKVVLNGHGSDELLAGYAGSVVPGFLAQILRSGGLMRYFREAKDFAPTGEWSTDNVLLEVLRSIIPTSLRPSTEEFLRALVQHDIALFPEARAVLRRMRSRRDATICLRGSKLSLLTTTLWSFLTVKILPMWLRMEDRVSMAHAVELRLPFTDYRLVEFVLTLPDDLKLKHGYTKYILRQAMQDILPPEIVLRRQKTRFSCPYSQWFRGSWRPLIEDLFLAGQFKLDPFMHVPEFRRRLRSLLRWSAVGPAPSDAVENTEHGDLDAHAHRCRNVEADITTVTSSHGVSYLIAPRCKGCGMHPTAVLDRRTARDTLQHPSCGSCPCAVRVNSADLSPQRHVVFQCHPDG